MPNPSPAHYVKRGFDVLVSGAVLAVASPALGGLCAAELVFHGWPPFFTQARPGYRGEVFRIVKFRTMTDERGSDGELLADAERLTAFGQFLRSTSLDELPELWNVLVGDMSLVGPRPLLVRYLERYSPEQARRHDAPPGVTGLAQVNGRNSLGWDEKFAFDVEYVDEWSLALDARVLLMTVSKVLKRDGIAAEGAATMPEFIGGSA